MKVTGSDPRLAVERIGRARRVLMTGHRSPDGDSLGSALALAELAANLGVESVIVNRDPAPANLERLPGIEGVLNSESPPSDFPEKYDLVVVLECPGLDRVGLTGLDGRPILNIDHHRANPAFGEVNFLDEEAPAVGEMVWNMFSAAGVQPTAAAATNAYVALSTDTGDFRYSNATPRAFLAAAEMVSAGAEPTTVAQWVHGGRTSASVRLLGEALRTLAIECDGRLATIEVDGSAFDRSTAQPADTDEIINVPRAIAGIDAVAFFKQWEPGVVRVSLRSRGDVDVRAVAAEFGGGGHTNAAGCTIEGDLDETRRRISTALVHMLESSS